MHHAPSSRALTCAGTRQVPLPYRGNVCCGQEELSNLPLPDRALQIPTSLCLTAEMEIQRDVSGFLPVNWAGSVPDG